MVDGWGLRKERCESGRVGVRSDRRCTLYNDRMGGEWGGEARQGVRKGGLRRRGGGGHSFVSAEDTQRREMGWLI